MHVHSIDSSSSTSNRFWSRSSGARCLANDCTLLIIGERRLGIQSFFLGSPLRDVLALRHLKHRPSLINFAPSSSVSFCLLNRWLETGCSVEATLSAVAKARRFRLLPTDPRGRVSTAFQRAVRAARIASDRVLGCSRMASARNPSVSPRTKSSALECSSKAV